MMYLAQGVVQANHGGFLHQLKNKNLGEMNEIFNGGGFLSTQLHFLTFFYSRGLHFSLCPLSN